MNSYLFISTMVVCWINANACEHYGDERCLNIKPIEGRHFLNQWIVEIKGGEDVARMVARETGFTYLEPASDRNDHYFFTHSEIPRRHKMQHNESLEILRTHEKVVRVGQQYVWKPTLNQLEDYKDFVGYEEPINVIVSTFDPTERIAYYEELRNRSILPAYEDEVIKEENEGENRAINDDAGIEKLPPLDEVIDLKGLYDLKQKMKLQSNQNLSG